ncbi:hypothetical protein KR215_008357, partial [Drosophila sulfurigaster]
MDYHLTQFLTDHGCFRRYLARFLHVDTPQCIYCVNEVESAEHVLLHCSRFTDERERLTRMIGSPLSPSGLLAAMMADAVTWQACHDIVINIMTRVRADETTNRP